MKKYLLVIKDERDLYNSLHIIIMSDLTTDTIEKYYGKQDNLQNTVKNTFNYDDGWFIFENIIDVDDIPVQYFSKKEK